MTGGLFSDEYMKVAAEYPDVTCNSMIADALNADVYKGGERYDALVMTNILATSSPSFAPLWRAALV
jgi:isocitrate/isopropylmalate dehydrogenase